MTIPDGMPAARILLVEDSPVQAQVLKMHLEGLGYEAIVAADLEQAQAAVAAGSVVAIVSDQYVPDGTGTEFCQWVRANPWTPRVPFILATATEGPQVVEQAIAVGVDLVLPKPLEGKLLGLALNAMLGKDIVAGANVPAHVDPVDLLRQLTLHFILHAAYASE